MIDVVVDSGIDAAVAQFSRHSSLEALGLGILRPVGMFGINPAVHSLF